MSLFRYQPEEWRTLRILGAFSFLMLAGLTSIGIAAETLYVAELGAAKMAFGIIAGQALVIPVFRVYGWLRSRLRATVVAPVVVVTLVISLLALFIWEQHRPIAATVALFVFVPSLAGLVGGEYGRLSAGLMNPRLARRLFPSIGSIGGFGATFGSFISGWVTSRLESQWLLLIGAGFLLATLAPAWLAARQQRPVPRRKNQPKIQISKHRYALLIAVSVAAIAAITTLLRYQLGAAALETHGQEGLGLFYSQIAFVINVSSVVFTLLLTRFTISNLGAANSLLIYPVVLLATVGGAIAAPALLMIAIAASSERLIRQNIHRTVSSLIAMPLHAAMRTRLALVTSGSARPLGTILASMAILLLTGELFELPWQLNWPSFSPITLGLALTTAGCLLYVRNRYIKELVGSLHARRLQLDDSGDAIVTMDPNVQKMLLSYLQSEHEERGALALTLFENHLDTDVVQAIEGQWENWSAELQAQALELLANDGSVAPAVLARLAAKDTNGVTQAIAARIAAGSWDDAKLRDQIGTHKGPSQAELILRFHERRRDNTLLALVQGLAASTDTVDRDTAVMVIANCNDETYDRLIPGLLPHAPKPLLQVLAARPNASLTKPILNWIGGEETAALARQALLALREDDVLPLLTRAISEPRLAAGIIDTLIEYPSARARTLLFDRLDKGDTDVQLRILTALANQDDLLNRDETQAVNMILDEVLNKAKYWQAVAAKSEGAMATVARGEQQFALEASFSALDCLHVAIPFRRLYLASQSFDLRQRALAAETLDEYLPRVRKRQVLELLEPRAAPADVDMPTWRDEISGDGVIGQRLQALTACGLFGDWRYDELRALATSASSVDEPSLCIRDGEVIDIEQVLLTGKNPAPADNDVLIGIKAIFSAIADHPRCGGLWLRGLAARIPEQDSVGQDVTRSEFMSLATRTLGDDRESADDIELWQRVFFLRTMALTQGLSTPRLRLLAEISRTLTAQSGDVVVNQGRLGNHFYMVCSGSLSVKANDENLTQLGPSDAFGALSLMQGARRSFTVIANEPSELLTIDRVDFLDLIDAHPALARSFSRTLATRIQAARSTHLAQ